jgi:hypothetical protein
MSEITLYQSALIGALIAICLLILTAIYGKLRRPLEKWIASLRMKSLFWKDKRKRARKSRK